MAKYKINSSKSDVILYSKDKQAEIEIREMAFFTIATNNIKYLRVSVTRQVKGLYDRNIKNLKKEIKEDIRRIKGLPCSWIGRINIVKMAIFKNAKKKFSAIPSKIPTHFIIELERAILKFIFYNRMRKPMIAKTIINSKTTSGGIIISDLKQFYRAIVLKSA